jgi:hypothetical protein
MNPQECVGIRVRDTDKRIKNTVTNEENTVRKGKMMII